MLKRLKSNLMASYAYILMRRIHAILWIDFIRKSVAEFDCIQTAINMILTISVTITINHVK